MPKDRNTARKDIMTPAYGMGVNRTRAEAAQILAAETIARMIAAGLPVNDTPELDALRAALAALQAGGDQGSSPKPGLPTEGHEAAVVAERQRIVAGLRHEADVLPCAEDAAVARSLADLVAANFSYDDADALATLQGPQ